MIQAKQQRSQQTQQKITQALYQRLQDKYFEHISIAELAELAGVSVGTFYRRFKDKQALLPVLYEAFGGHLVAWVEQLCASSLGDLDSACQYFTHSTYAFVEKHSGVFRTLHLNARLQPDVLPESTFQHRRTEYERLSLWLATQMEQQEADITERCGMVIFLVVNACIDKVLYAHLTPSIASKLEGEPFCDELALVARRYLQG